METWLGKQALGKVDQVQHQPTTFDDNGSLHHIFLFIKLLFLSVLLLLLTVTIWTLLCFVGWHIECSAMCCSLLGESIDIHSGGMDLMFPHHTNEILQSEAVTGKQYSRFWMHNGFVSVNSEKMSKSLQNFQILR